MIYVEQEESQIAGNLDFKTSLNLAVEGILVISSKQFGYEISLSTKLLLMCANWSRTGKFLSNAFVHLSTE